MYCSVIDQQHKNEFKYKQRHKSRVFSQNYYDYLFFNRKHKNMHEQTFRVYLCIEGEDLSWCIGLLACCRAFVRALACREVFRTAPLRAVLFVDVLCGPVVSCARPYSVSQWQSGRRELK